MRILFDHGTPAPLALLLDAHTVHKSKALSWDRLTNGELLKAAEEAGNDVLLTTDKNMQYRQNLTGRKISIVVLGNSQWPVLRLHADRVVIAVEAASQAATANSKSRGLTHSVRE